MLNPRLVEKLYLLRRGEIQYIGWQQIYQRLNQEVRMLDQMIICVLFVQEVEWWRDTVAGETLQQIGYIKKGSPVKKGRDIVGGEGFPRCNWHSGSNLIYCRNIYCRYIANILWRYIVGAAFSQFIVASPGIFSGKVAFLRRTKVCWGFPVDIDN